MIREFRCGCGEKLTVDFAEMASYLEVKKLGWLLVPIVNLDAEDHVQCMPPIVLCPACRERVRQRLAR